MVRKLVTMILIGGALGLAACTTERGAQAVHARAGAGRDQTANDDILLEARERVDLALNRGFGQHARRLLERRGGDEAAGLQAGLGDAEQHRLALGTLLLLLEASVDL